MIDRLTQETDRAVRKFIEGIPVYQRKIYDHILSQLKELTLYSDGSIKNNYENVRRISRIKREIEKIVFSNNYVASVNDFIDAYSEVARIQNVYFAKLSSDFTPTKVLKEVKDQAVNDVVDMLTKSGIDVNFLNPIKEIIKVNIKSGGSYAELTEQLRKEIIGTKDIDGKLMKYAQQVVTDSINQYSATYTKIITDDLGLEWFRYVGTIIKTSRPFCVALVKKSYIHKDEFPEILKGNIDGKKVSLAGLNANTTAENFPILRGGWNCGHQLIPISTESVPKRLRDK